MRMFDIFRQNISTYPIIIIIFLPYIAIHSLLGLVTVLTVSFKFTLFAISL